MKWNRWLKYTELPRKSLVILEKLPQSFQKYSEFSERKVVVLRVIAALRFIYINEMWSQIVRPLPCEYLYSDGRRHWRLACSWISPGERGRPSPPWWPRPGRGSRCHWRPSLATVPVCEPAVQESWRREGSCWSSASQLSSPSSLCSDCGPQCWHRSLLLFTHGGVPLCPPHVNLANITTSRPRRRLCDEGPVSMSCQ